MFTKIYHMPFTQFPLMLTAYKTRIRLLEEEMNITILPLAKLKAIWILLVFPKQVFFLFQNPVLDTKLHFVYIIFKRNIVYHFKK